MFEVIFFDAEGRCRKSQTFHGEPLIGCDTKKLSGSALFHTIVSTLKLVAFVVLRMDCKSLGSRLAALPDALIGKLKLIPPHLRT